MSSDTSMRKTPSSPVDENDSAVAKTVLFICNDLAYFKAHRSSIARGLLALGVRVHVCAAGSAKQAKSLPAGAVFHPVELERHAFDPISDFGFMRKCRDLVRQLDPDAVHLITIKPNVYGGLALSLRVIRRSPGMQPRRVVMTFPGLGRVFENGLGLTRRVRRILALSGLRRAARVLKVDATFENSADRDSLVKLGVYSPERTHLTFGAGIATAKFRPATVMRRGPLTYLFASRLLNAKGLGVFIEAARLCRLQGSDARFVVAGPLEQRNPDRFSQQALEAAASAGIVDFRGAVDDAEMPELLRSADVVCLPTRLSEGFPRILIEAAASGCALIASRQPSIAQIIEHGETGYMIDPSDVTDLLAAMTKLDAEPALARSMGANAADFTRRMPVDEVQVNETFMALYGLAV